MSVWSLKDRVQHDSAPIRCSARVFPLVWEAAWSWILASSDVDDAIIQFGCGLSARQERLVLHT